jgi:hypothetical protein
VKVLVGGECLEVLLIFSVAVFHGYLEVNVLRLWIIPFTHLPNDFARRFHHPDDTHPPPP